MTDITELAQREKFEAWAEHACAAPWGYLKKRRTTEVLFRADLHLHVDGMESGWR
ncbi:TPA: hypothetical protein ROU65_001626 [Raoultella ornithinolytica]|nr:hypothetical protein [Raoultella ornithinolytica]HDX8334829.1 hypothetical protein [Raoultella ornithinolytica]